MRSSQWECSALVAHSSSMLHACQEYKCYNDKFEILFRSWLRRLTNFITISIMFCRTFSSHKNFKFLELYVLKTCLYSNQSTDLHSSWDLLLAVWAKYLYYFQTSDARLPQKMHLENLKNKIFAIQRRLLRYSLALNGLLRQLELRLRPRSPGS